MKFTISSEALHLAIKNVLSVTTGKSDTNSTFVIEAKGEGVEVRRSSVGGYAEHFIYASVEKQGLLCFTGSNLFDFLVNLEGEIKCVLEGKTLVIYHDLVERSTVKTVPDNDAYLHQKVESPETFAKLPDEIKSLLWANPDLNDEQWGRVFMFERYAGVVNTGGTRFASMILDEPVNEPIVFNTDSISLLGKESLFATVGNNAWFKRGGFLFRVPCPADKSPNALIRMFAEREATEEDNYFIVESDKFLKILRTVSGLGKSSELNNQSRCYIHLMNGSKLYVESIGSEISEGVSTTIEVLEGRGDVDFCIVAEYLESAISQREMDHEDKDKIKILLLNSKKGNLVYPFLIGKKTRRLTQPVHMAWKPKEH